VSCPVIIRPDAEADIRDIKAELEAARPGWSVRFAAQLRSIFEQIEANPTLFAKSWRDVRAVRVPKFQYVVYYIAFDGQTEVIAVIHGARKSTVWRKRR